MRGTHLTERQVDGIDERCIATRRNERDEALDGSGIGGEGGVDARFVGNARQKRLIAWVAHRQDFTG